MLETFIELDRWGRPPYVVAPKISKATVKKRGDALDRADAAVSSAWVGDCGRYWLTPDTMPAEQFHRLCDRRHVAAMKYSSAISARGLAARMKLENARRIPMRRDAVALRDAMHAAQARYDEIVEAGPEFSTERERIDAQTAAELAASIYEIAQAKYHDAQRAERITGTHPRSRPAARLVTDGYVKTGKYKMIDGVRVPVLEKVE